MINQSIAAQTLGEFQQFGVTHSENFFFGIPVSDYFAQPDAIGAGEPSPAQSWVTDRQPVQHMITRFAEMNRIQTKPTFFGVPVADYFGRTEDDIWEQILHDVTTLAVTQ